MSTRCNIRLKTAATGKVIWLYRHHDGYPSVTGADLADTLKGLRYYSAYEIANELMGKQYDATTHTPARAIYNVTDGQHGDIEWRYDITIKLGSAEIRVMKLGSGRKWVDNGTLTFRDGRSNSPPLSQISA